MLREWAWERGCESVRGEYNSKVQDEMATTIFTLVDATYGDKTVVRIIVSCLVFYFILFFVYLLTERMARENCCIMCIANFLKLLLRWTPLL
jgi:hypothetical protein